MDLAVGLPGPRRTRSGADHRVTLTPPRVVLDDALTWRTAAGLTCGVSAAGYIIAAAYYPPLPASVAWIALLPLLALMFAAAALLASDMSASWCTERGLRGSEDYVRLLLTASGVPPAVIEGSLQKIDLGPAGAGVYWPNPYGYGFTAGGYEASVTLRGMRVVRDGYSDLPVLVVEWRDG